MIEILNNKNFAKTLEIRFSEFAICISVITQIELLGYPDITADEETKINAFLSDVTVIGIDALIAETAIAIKRNKSKKIKLPNAVVAATAIAHNATLVTRDDDLLKLQYASLNTCPL